MNHQSNRVRRGSVYVAVLAVCLLVTVIGLSAMALVRHQRVSTARLADVVQARLNARSMAEVGTAAIAATQGWRAIVTGPRNVLNAPSVALARGTGVIAVSDPLDGDLLNRPTDPVTVRAIGIAGDALQMLDVRLNAVGTPLEALKYAIAARGEIRIDGEHALEAVGAPVATNARLTVDGVLIGSGRAAEQSVGGSGRITGTFAPLTTPLSMPGVAAANLYEALGTRIVLASLSRVALGPGANPFGSANADGVYVIKSGGDVTISDTRILGTLVVRAPGRKVTITGRVSMKPARADYPALIVEADELVLSYRSDVGGRTGMVLSENATLSNYNPSGVPYNGATDFDILDTYPSVIEGLVHSLGKVTISGGARVKGAILTEEPSADAVRVSISAEVDWDPTLVTSPPMGYTSRIDMVEDARTWARAVNP